MPVAVVSGVTGQDGSILARQLLKKGYDVVGTKRRTSTFNTQRIEDIYNHPNFKIEYFDLSDASSINRIIAKYKPHEYYNLAAQSHVRVSFDAPEDTINGIVMGTLHALEAIKNISPQTRFYQASSSEMYGDNPYIPSTGFTEYSKFMPASPYGVAKVAAHNLVNNYRKSYGLHASCGILFNHESEWRGETFVTRKITMAAAKIKLGLQDKLELGNLEALRDWGYAPEFTEIMWRMLQQSVPRDYVIATGEMHSVKEFLEYVFDFAELDLKKYLYINPVYFRPHEVPVLKGNSDFASRSLGWKPEVKFKELAEIMYISDMKRLKDNGH